MATNIYTTGAYLSPKQMPDGAWCWIVDQFEDDTFKGGDIYNPKAYAETEAELIKNGDDENE
jgi:hypothetical protein